MADCGATPPSNSSVADWADAFYGFLLDNNHHKSAAITTKNLHNLYKLLFVPSQRPPHQTVQGPAPAVEGILEHLFTKGDLVKGESDAVTFAET